MNTKGIIDVWMQHPNKKFINHPMFSSLRRWNHEEVGKEIETPALEVTIYPIITPKKCLEEFDKLNLSEDVANKFLFQNAMKVFKLKI